MREPVRILSDLHLGHDASTIDDVACLAPLIDGAGTVIFNGDTWQELASVFRPRGEVLLGALRELCARLGADPVFLPGNHDPGWDGPGWVGLAGGRVVVTHGDAVLWAGSPWSREAFARADQVRALWDAHRGADGDADERLRLAREIARTLRAASYGRGRSWPRRVCDALDPPRRAWEIARIWLAHGRATAEFGRHYFPRAEFLVVGHFHRPGLWESTRPTVINTGAHLHPHRAWWVEWNRGWLRCGKIQGRGEEDRRRGETRGVWRLGGG